MWVVYDFENYVRFYPGVISGKGGKRFGLLGAFWRLGNFWAIYFSMKYSAVSHTLRISLYSSVEETLVLLQKADTRPVIQHAALNSKAVAACRWMRADLILSKIALRLLDLRGCTKFKHLDKKTEGNYGYYRTVRVATR